MTPTLIDPLTPRPRHPHAPPIQHLRIDAFTASHLLAFGTDWRLSDYWEEAKARVHDGERFSFVVDSAFYNDLLARLVAEGDRAEGVKHYLSARGLSLRLQHAGQVLAEGCERGIVRSEATSGGETYTALPPEAWRYRARFNPFRGVLFKQHETPMRTVEWAELLFNRDDVEAIRTASWHSLGANVDVFAEGANENAKPPAVIEFSERAATLSAALAAVEAAGLAPSKGNLAAQCARLYREAWGQGRSRSETVEGVAESIERQWAAKARKRSLEWLLARAARG